MFVSLGSWYSTVSPVFGMSPTARSEPLPILSCQIDAEDLLRPDALRPGFAVPVVTQAGEVQLDAIVVIRFGQRVVFDLAGLGIDIAQRSLEHRVEPERAVLVEF